MKSFKNQYSIRQGKITLYQRTSQGSKYQSDSWYARFKIPNQKTIRKSLKTNNQNEAEIIAEDLYQELAHKNKLGLSLSTKRFELVCQSYLKHFKTQTEQESKLSKLEQKHTKNMLKMRMFTINRFVIPFLGEKNIDDINDLDIEDYIRKRRTFFINGEGSKESTITYIRNNKKVTRPHNTTKVLNYNSINKELTVLRQIFEFARQTRVISFSQIPVIKNLSKPKNYVDRKPGISLSDYNSLLAKLRWKIKKQDNSKHKRSHRLLYYYIIILSNTGLRVTESKNLRFSDCKTFKKDGNEYLEMYIHGKGKSRKMIPMPRTKEYLKRLKEFHIENSKLFGWKFTDNTNVFVNDRGVPISSFKRSLDAILDECGILYDENKAKRSSGAFRKFYITMRLTEGKVDVFRLAKNTGTSIEVIEKYYEDLQPRDIAEEFTRLKTDVKLPIDEILYNISLIKKNKEL